MREFHTQITIESPAEQVWRVLADVERWPEWTASVSRCELLDETPLTMGSRIRIHQPKLQPAVWTVTQWHPARWFVWVARHPGLVVVAEHALEPDPAGCTLTLRLTFKGLLGGLVGFLSRNLTNDYLALEGSGLMARSEGRK